MGVLYCQRLTGAQTKYATYDMELYVVVQASQHWCYYLIHIWFVLISDHEELWVLNSKIQFLQAKQNDFPSLKNIYLHYKKQVHE